MVDMMYSPMSEHQPCDPQYIMNIRNIGKEQKQIQSETVYNWSMSRPVHQDRQDYRMDSTHLKSKAKGKGERQLGKRQSNAQMNTDKHWVLKAKYSGFARDGTGTVP